MDEPTEREPLSDEALAMASASLMEYVRSHDHAGAFACCSAHAAADWVNPLLKELKRTRAELAARVEAESADAAAGSYAGRAEEAEAENRELRTKLATRGDLMNGLDAEVERLRAGAEIDRLTIEKLSAAHDAATARAEQAEAALAELRQEWGVANEAFASIPFPSEAHARNALRTWNTEARYPWRLMVRDQSEWRDATPRTVLERATVEQDVQPVRCGSECSEGHTYEPGSCEAAMDPDEVIAQNHADAMRDWGIADA